jgi:hypothetical protein
MDVEFPFGYFFINTIPPICPFYLTNKGAYVFLIFFLNACGAF